MARMSDAVVQQDSNYNFISTTGASSVEMTDAASAIKTVEAAMSKLSIDFALPETVKALVDSKISALADTLKSDLTLISSSNGSIVEKNTETFRAVDNYKHEVSKVIASAVTDNYKSEVLKVEQVSKQIDSALNIISSNIKVQTDTVPMTPSQNTTTSVDMVPTPIHRNIKVKTDTVPMPINAGQVSIVDTSEPMNMSVEAGEFKADVNLTPEVSPFTPSTADHAVPVVTEMTEGEAAVVDTFTATPAEMTEGEKEVVDFAVEAKKSEGEKFAADMSAKFKEVGGKYSSWADSFGSNYENLGQDLAGLFLPTVTDLVDTAVNKTTDVLLSTKTAGYLSNPVTLASDIFSDSLHEISRGFEEVIDTVFDGSVGWLDNKVTGFVDRASDFLSGTVRNATNWLVDRLRGRKFDYLKAKEEYLGQGSIHYLDLKPFKIDKIRKLNSYLGHESLSDLYKISSSFEADRKDRTQYYLLNENETMSRADLDMKEYDYSLLEPDRDSDQNEGPTYGTAERVQTSKPDNTSYSNLRPTTSGRGVGSLYDNEKSIKYDTEFHAELSQLRPTTSGKNVGSLYVTEESSDYDRRYEANIQSLEVEDEHYVTPTMEKKRSTPLTTAEFIAADKAAEDEYERYLHGWSWDSRTTPSVTSKVVSRDMLRVVTSESDSPSSISQMQMSNDMFWNVNIVPHTYNGGGNTVSLREAYKVGSDSSTDYLLPIASYSFSGEEVKHSNFQVEGNVNFAIALPSGLSRPTRLSVTLPELLVTENGSTKSCLQKFKDEFISTHYSGNSIPDFRDCAYEITVTKYSPQWQVVREWGFLGIPEINTSEQGTSSSSAEFAEFSFLIVGENFESNTSSNAS